MLRVIAGKYKGQKLNHPPLEVTRPTTDRAREGIFSSIQFNIKGSVVLDLFSGSGANAIESISRGATKAISVEKNKDAFKSIQLNIKKLKINNITLYKNDVIDFLDLNKGIKFDFIFLDPPYQEYELLNLTLKKLKNGNFLKKTGLIFCETDNPLKIDLPNDFVIQKEKKYGKTKILAIANNI